MNPFHSSEAIEPSYVKWSWISPSTLRKPSESTRAQSPSPKDYWFFQGRFSPLSYYWRPSLGALRKSQDYRYRLRNKNRTNSQNLRSILHNKTSWSRIGISSPLGIIRAHSAALAVQSQEGQGSEFWLLFPISHKPVKPGPTRVIIPDAKPTSSSQSMKVLVVDDEEDVREACSWFSEKLEWSHW